MKQIPLTQWKFALVDDEDFEYVSKYKWYTHKNLNKYYAVRNIMLENKKYSLTQMHAFIMNTPKWMVIDHINGDWLDNRRENLRICTRRENQLNRGKSKNNKSWFKGVSLNKKTGKWRASIQINNKLRHLWTFSDKLEAYNIYCEAAKKYHWEFAHF